MTDAAWRNAVEETLMLVLAERERQFKRYGTNAGLADGTGPNVSWALPLSRRQAVGIERVFRNDYEEYESVHGAPTWMHLVREEVAEAFAEEDPDKLVKELTQVAALCCSWIQQIRTAQETGEEMCPGCGRPMWLEPEDVNDYCEICVPF